MSERPPFDPVRAAFWLVAFVIGVYAAICLASVAVCVINTLSVGQYKCDSDTKIIDLLGAALAAALAFAGGMMRGGPPKE